MNAPIVPRKDGAIGITVQTAMKDVLQILDIPPDQSPRVYNELYKIGIDNGEHFIDVLDRILRTPADYEKQPMSKVIEIMSRFKKKDKKDKKRGNANNRHMNPPRQLELTQTTPTAQPYTPPTRTLRWKVDSKSPTPITNLVLPTGMRIPTVFYTAQVKGIIDYLVQKCTEEVGWLGTVQILESGDYLVDQIFVPRQTVCATETDIDTAAMGELAEELFAMNKDPSTLFYWGHSHVNMGVTPSGQDETQIAEYLEDCPRFIRGIYNKRGDSKVDVYDVTNRVIHQCVPQRVQYSLPEETRTRLDQLITTNVQKRAYQYQRGTVNTPNSQYGKYDLDLYERY
jgi:hypothetical protein